MRLLFFNFCIHCLALGQCAGFLLIAGGGHSLVAVYRLLLLHQHDSRVHRLQWPTEYRFSSCGSWALENRPRVVASLNSATHGMWRSSWTRDQTHVLCLAGGLLTTGPPGSPYLEICISCWSLPSTTKYFISKRKVRKNTFKFWFSWIWRHSL